MKARKQDGKLKQKHGKVLAFPCLAIILEQLF